MMMSSTDCTRELIRSPIVIIVEIYDHDVVVSIVPLALLRLIIQPGSIVLRNVSGSFAQISVCLGRVVYDLSG